MAGGCGFTHPYSTAGECLDINGMVFGQEREELEDTSLHCQTLVILECLQLGGDEVIVTSSSERERGVETWRTMVRRFFFLTEERREGLKNFSKPISLLSRPWEPITHDYSQMAGTHSSMTKLSLFLRAI